MTHLMCRLLFVLLIIPHKHGHRCRIVMEMNAIEMDELHASGLSRLLLPAAAGHMLQRLTKNKGQQHMLSRVCVWGGGDSHYARKHLHHQCPPKFAKIIYVPSLPIHASMMPRPHCLVFVYSDPVVKQSLQAQKSAA